MEKEIIIDGVDVTGCIQFVEDDNCCCDLGGDCKGWENCYYKQLKRLEQENAELKAENDKLKEEIKQLEDFIKSDGEIDHINHKYTYKLQQTLQEIKAISETGMHCEGMGCDFMPKILDLITKAEEE